MGNQSLKQNRGNLTFPLICGGGNAVMRKRVVDKKSVS